MKISKIYFVGIKGAGMTPLSIIASQAGFEVRGSDISDEFITDSSLKEHNLQIDVNFDEKAVSSFFDGTPKNCCLLVTTGAHKGFDNPQAVWAKANGIKVLSQGQALALFMDGEIFERDFKSIAVAGSHGKTTISSLLATTMKGYGLDPTYSVGTSEVFPLGSPGHYGLGEYFIAEADEYASEPVYDKTSKFLYMNPSYAIFNNIDFDHPDIFSTIEEIEDVFLKFAENIKSHGILLVNGDDRKLAHFKEKVSKDIKVITYGENNSCDYTINQIVAQGLESRFNVLKKGVELGHFELSVPGMHNAKNALSVIALMSELGFESEKIRICLKEFRGTKRRSELVGQTQYGSVVYDDYAHHPKEISTTISSLKQAYPNKKLVCIFQPHTYSRTKSLLDEFSSAFLNAHETLLLPIFKSARDTEKDVISQDEYQRGFEALTNAKFFSNFEDVIEYVGQTLTSNEYLIVTFGAGDVYKIARKIVK